MSMFARRSNNVHYLKDNDGHIAEISRMACHTEGECTPFKRSLNNLNRRANINNTHRAARHVANVVFALPGYISNK